MTLPPLPDAVPSHKGPVPVVVSPDPVTPDGRSSWGYWEPTARQIVIWGAITPVDQWHTLLHEMTHLALADADVELTRKDEEAVCAAVSLYLIGQMMQGAVAFLVPASGAGV